MEMPRHTAGCILLCSSSQHTCTHADTQRECVHLFVYSVLTNDNCRIYTDVTEQMKALETALTNSNVTLVLFDVIYYTARFIIRHELLRGIMFASFHVRTHVTSWCY